MLLKPFTKQLLGDMALSFVWEARDLYLNLKSEFMCADCPWPYFVQTRTGIIAKLRLQLDFKSFSVIPAARHFQFLMLSLTCTSSPQDQSSPRSIQTGLIPYAEPFLCILFIISILSLTVFILK